VHRRRLVALAHQGNHPFDREKPQLAGEDLLANRVAKHDSQDSHVTEHCLAYYVLRLYSS